MASRSGGEAGRARCQGGERPGAAATRALARLHPRPGGPGRPALGGPLVGAGVGPRDGTGPPRPWRQRGRESPRPPAPVGEPGPGDDPGRGPGRHVPRRCRRQPARPCDPTDVDAVRHRPRRHRRPRPPEGPRPLAGCRRPPPRRRRARCARALRPTPARARHRAAPIGPGRRAGGGSDGARRAPPAPGGRRREHDRGHLREGPGRTVPRLQQRRREGRAPSRRRRPRARRRRPALRPLRDHPGHHRCQEDGDGAAPERGAAPPGDGRRPRRDLAQGPHHRPRRVVAALPEPPGHDGGRRARTGGVLHPDAPRGPGAGQRDHPGRHRPGGRLLDGFPDRPAGRPREVDPFARARLPLSGRLCRRDERHHARHHRAQGRRGSPARERGAFPPGSSSTRSPPPRTSRPRSSPRSRSARASPGRRPRTSSSRARPG